MHENNRKSLFIITYCLLALKQQPVEVSEEEGKEAIKESLASKGIGYDDLTPKEWAEIFERYALIRKGYEFSSKTGVSIGSYYGKDADTKKKRWSRINQKIRKTQPEIQLAGHTNYTILPEQ